MGYVSVAPRIQEAGSGRKDSHASLVRRYGTGPGRPHWLGPKGGWLRCAEIGGTPPRARQAAPLQMPDGAVLGWVVRYPGAGTRPAPTCLGCAGLGLVSGAKALAWILCL